MDGTSVKIKQFPWFTLPSVQIFSPAILKYGGMKQEWERLEIHT